MPGTRTIIVGLGNPMLGDDGVGFRVAEEVQKALEQRGSQSPDIEIDMLAVGGIALMERLIDFDRAIIIDIINTGKFQHGAVSSFPLEAIENPFAGHLGSAHETNLHTALEMGRLLGARLPDVVDIVAIESPYVYDFTEEITPLVAAAVPEATRVVFDLLKEITIQEGEL